MSEAIDGLVEEWRMHLDSGQSTGWENTGRRHGKCTRRAEMDGRRNFGTFTPEECGTSGPSCGGIGTPPSSGMPCPLPKSDSAQTMYAMDALRRFREQRQQEEEKRTERTKRAERRAEGRRARNCVIPEVLPVLPIKLPGRNGIPVYDGVLPMSPDEAASFAVFLESYKSGKLHASRSARLVWTRTLEDCQFPSQDTLEAVRSEFRKRLAEDPDFRRSLSRLSGLCTSGKRSDRRGGST